MWLALLPLDGHAAFGAADHRHRDLPVAHQLLHDLPCISGAEIQIAVHTPEGDPRWTCTTDCLQHAVLLAAFFTACAVPVQMIQQTMGTGTPVLGHEFSELPVVT